MNERIIELMEQAEIGENRYTAEKFAQLIVKECISLVNLRQKFAIEDGLNAEHALDILVYDIEQHFGVDG